jgi:hypothetical protein
VSRDEFDPEMERLFARAPALPDDDLFAARVEARLAQGSRMRAVALAVAGVVGGAVAVREAVTVRLAPGEGPVAGRALGQGLENLGQAAGSLAQSGLDALGLQGLEFGALGGVQLFWVTAAALVALLTAGVVRLSQDA